MIKEFISELAKRSICLSDRATNGHVWIKINLDKCDNRFVTKLENLLSENRELFKLHIRGIDYYVELLGCDTLDDALSRATFASQ